MTSTVAAPICSSQPAEGLGVQRLATQRCRSARPTTPTREVVRQPIRPLPGAISPSDRAEDQPDEQRGQQRRQRRTHEGEDHEQQDADDEQGEEHGQRLAAE